MDKIKEIIKSKDFIINSLILKNIKNFDISLNEFLLILYFINVDNVLDLERIKSFIALDENTAMSMFDSLIKKGIIEVIIKKNGNIVEEEISLENFYNKLIMDIPEDNKVSDIYSEFEREFGRTLSPIEYETITKWLDKNVSEETIKMALKEAVLNGVNSLRYVDKIIYEWSKKDLKHNINNNSKDEVVFDYNWLEDEG